MGDEGDSCGLLLRDIEEIGKALYLHNNTSKAFNSSPDHHRRNVSSTPGILESESKAVTKDSSRKDKKTSFWNWKPLKALTHIRHHRFNCCFFLQVHSIESLPSDFNNLNLCIGWKRKSDMLQTNPAPVCAGISEIEETLMHRCTVYARKTGPHSTAKYESKLFLLQTSVIEAPMLDIGKQWIDLTRLLPLTLEELVGEERSLGKWTTSFKLTGKANGAVLNVSFGFSILDGNSFEPDYFVKVPDIVKVCKLMGGDHFADLDARSQNNQLHNFDEIFPATSKQGSDIKNLDDIFANRLPVLAPSITMLYQKLDEGKMGNDVEADNFYESSELKKLESGHLHEVDREHTGPENNDTDFTIIDQGVEIVKDQLRINRNGSQRFDSSLIEIIDVADILKEEELAFDDNVEGKSKLGENEHKENESATDESEFKKNSGFVIEQNVKDLPSAVNVDLISGSIELDSLPYIIKNYDQEIYSNVKSRKSLSLDDFAESIENDFLNMLSIDQSPAIQVSDNGLETVTWENTIVDTDSDPTNNFDLSVAIQACHTNQATLTLSMMRKRNARMLESFETQSLMHEWGLNENPFQNCPLVTSGGFGSPVYPPKEEPLKLPSVGEELGPIIRIKDGGFLRSMNPLLFVNAKHGSRLIVQLSAPVVLPAAMGSTTMEVLKCWAVGGAENMSAQIKELLSLEDITGKTIQEIVLEAKSCSDTSKRYSFSVSEDMESEYVSFENLVPMAMTHIEGLFLEGLKIQSGMPDQEPPSSIMLQLSEYSSSVGKDSETFGNFSSDRALVDNVVKYSLLLEEWIRFDSGDFDAKDEVDENISEVFAAHHIDLHKVQHKKDDEAVKSLRRDGFLNNDFIMALKVQLRDPLRDYESVGSPMLALIQVKRVYLPLQYGEPNMSSDKTCEVEIDKLSQEEIGFEQKQIINEKCFPKFKVLEGHLAGLNVSSSYHPFWGSIRHQQSGSRWLLSSGMAGTHKNLVSDSNTIVKSSAMEKKALSEDVLWSISSHTSDEAVTWSEPVALNVHVRNPDIVFPNESSDL